MNSHADACSMFGQNDILCESEKLGEEIEEDMRLDQKCFEGDDLACRKLAELRKKFDREEKNISYKKYIYELRMQCYQSNDRAACNRLDELVK